MKNIVKLFGIIALTAIIGFSMAACGDSGSDNGSDPEWMEYTAKIGGKNMSLTITKTAPRSFTPIPGDAYILYFDSKISTGAVVTFANGVFSLKPALLSAQAFSISTSSEGITDVNGIITWTDNTETDTSTDSRFVEGNIEPDGTGSSDDSNTGQETTIVITGLPSSLIGYSAFLQIASSSGVPVAGGFREEISGTSVSITILEDMEEEILFTGRGSYILSFITSSWGPEDDQAYYFYTNGQTWPQLNLSLNSSPDQVISRIPKYNISSATSTIAFDRFRLSLDWSFLGGGEE